MLAFLNLNPFAPLYVPQRLVEYSAGCAAGAYAILSAHNAAERAERINSHPQEEKLPDFGAATIPANTNVSSDLVTPFCRLWKFECLGRAENSPRFVIGAPNSGTSAAQMREMIAELLPFGDVLLIQQVPPRYVSREHKNGLADSTAAYIKVAEAHPGCHWIGYSQSCINLVAAAAEVLKLNRSAAMPASITLIAGPLYPQLAPTSISSLGQSRLRVPVVTIGVAYEGIGREIFPGTLAKIAFTDPQLGTGGRKVEAQDVPKEHLEDMLIYYKTGALPNAKRPLSEELEILREGGIPIFRITGEKDHICSPPQTLGEQPQGQHLTIPGAGHYDLVQGPTLTQKVVPAIRAFVAAACPT